MLTLLSPAKKLLNFEKPYQGFTSIPVFDKESVLLIKLMQSQSPQDLAKLMHLSETLSRLNYQRYQNFLHAEGYPAVFLFQGDVYQGLKAKTWSKEVCSFAQTHLVILSGLYGLLKPLDKIKPYRLEMGTALKNPLGKNLYDFWKKSIASELNKRLADHQNPVLINLASNEYFKAVDQKSLHFPIVHIHFMEQVQNQCRTIGIHAKKARGAMADYIMQQQVEDTKALKQFKALNYQFCKKQSDKSNLVFIREH